MLLTIHDDIFPQITTKRLAYDPSLYPPATNPVFKAEASVSGGYTDISTIENWPLFGGETQLNAEDIKDEVDALVAAKTFAACTDEEKDVASRWFVVDKSDRDTRHTAAEQEVNAEILIRNIVIRASEGKIITFRDLIKDESAANIKTIISNIERFSICFSDQEIGIDTAARSIISSTTTTFVSFAGSGPNDEAGLSFHVPRDYKDGGKFGYIWSMDGSSANQGRIELDITQQPTASTIEHTTTHEQIETLENGYSGTAWRILRSSLYAPSVITLAANDFLHIQLTRDPGHVNDLLSDTMYISVFIFSYNSKL